MSVYTPFPGVILILDSSEALRAAAVTAYVLTAIFVTVWCWVAWKTR